MRKRLLILHAISPLGPDETARLIDALDIDVTFVAWADRVVGGAATLDRLAELGSVLRVEDVKEIVPAALDYAAAHRVDGVLASSELLLAEAAEVAEELDLPHHPVSAIPALLRKDVQRARLRAAGVPTPASAVLHGPDDIAAALAAVPLPAVLKPVRGMGSMTTFRVDIPDDLRHGLADGQLSYGQAPPVPGEEPVFQLEEYLGGDHPHPVDPRLDDMLSVECLLFRGTIEHVVVGDKPPMTPPFRDTGHIMPSALPEDVRAEVVEMADRAVRAVGAYHGAVLVQIKLTSAGPRVIEVNGRNGFAVPLALLPLGYDYLTDIARVALGDPPLLPAGFAGHSLVLRVYTPPDAGEVTGISGIEQARMLPGVTYAIPLMAPGHRPDPFRPGDSVAYLVGARTRDLATLLDLMERVTARVRVQCRPLVAAH